MKYVVSFLCIIAILLYKFREDRRIKNTRVDNRQLKSIKLRKNRRSFENKISNVCGQTSKCYLSEVLVNTVAEMVKENGLQQTIRYLRNNRSKFTTDGGEYVWIHAYDDENQGYYYEYHHYLIIDGLGATEAQNNVNKGYCNEKLCNIAKTLHGTVQMLRNSSQGYHTYNWYSPITKKIIKKRSFIRKLKNIETHGTRRDIFIGSGSTIDNVQRPVNWSAIFVYVMSFCIFTLTWYLIGADTMMGNSILSPIIFYFVLGVYAFNIINFETIRLDNEDSLRSMYVSYFSSSISTSLITLALSIILFKTLNIENKKSRNLSIQLLCISIIFSFLSFIELNLQDSEENLNIKIALKQSFGLNCVGFILTTILFVYMNLKQ